MADLAAAFGLLLVIEGVFYALTPDAAPRLLELIRALGPDRVRAIGLTAAAIGLLIIWAVRGG